MPHRYHIGIDYPQYNVRAYYKIMGTKGEKKKYAILVSIKFLDSGKKIFGKDAEEYAKQHKIPTMLTVTVSETYTTK